MKAPPSHIFNWPHFFRRFILSGLGLGLVAFGFSTGPLRGAPEKAASPSAATPDRNAPLKAGVEASVEASVEANVEVKASERKDSDAKANPLLPPLEFDKDLASQFSKDFVLYLAIRDVDAHGPLMDRAMDEDQAKGLGKNAKNVTQMFTKLKEAAVAQGIVEEDLRELFERGLSVGIVPPESGKGEPNLLVVIPAGKRLDRFHDLIISRYTAEHGEKALGTVDLGNGRTAKILKNAAPQRPPVLFKDGGYVYLSSDADLIATALEERENPGSGYHKTRAYRKSRELIKEDLVGFLVIPPKKFLEAVARAEEDPQKKAQYEQALVASQAVDGFLAQVVASETKSEILGTVIFNRKHPKFDQVDPYLPSRGLQSHKVMPSGVSIFLSLLRPADLFALVAPQNHLQVEAQTKQVKGMVQMQAGLRFEEDIKPWWGQEIAISAMTPLGQPQPQIAIALESTDDDAAKKALDKVVNHLTYTRNQPFEEQTIGQTSVQVGQANPQSPGLTPVLAQVPGFVVAATGPQIVEEILTSSQKIYGSRGFVQSTRSVDPDRMAFSLQVKMDMLKNLPQLNNPPGPQARPGVEALKNLTEKLDSILLTIGLKGQDALNLSLVFVGR